MRDPIARAPTRRGSLDASDRAAIVAVIRSLHRDLAEGRADAAVDRLEPMLRGMALLRKGVMESIRTRYGAMVNESAWSLAPLDEQTLNVVPHGRLVRVSADGPLIETPPLGESGARLRIPSLYLAKLDGDWSIVRRGP